MVSFIIIFGTLSFPLPSGNPENLTLGTWRRSFLVKLNLSGRCENVNVAGVLGLGIDAVGLGLWLDAVGLGLWLDAGGMLLG